MRQFDYLPVTSIEEAISARPEGGVFYAGGTDVLPLMKLDVLRTGALVDLKTSDLPRGVTQGEEYLQIGALTTLSELEQHPQLQSEFAVLAQAAAQAATPQLRNRATVAGNLLQRPRCWYYRHRQVTCWLQGGDDCPAVEGQNQHHAIFNQSRCHAVHPSDLAPALLALDASVTLRGAAGERRVHLADFYAAPEPDRRRETRIATDELLVSIDIPRLPAGSRSLYLKAMDRKVWAFALASVAAVRVNGEWRLALGGVAATPRRLHESEALLNTARANDGSKTNAETWLLAIRAALTDAVALQHNAYKINLVERLLQQVLEELGDG